MPLPAAAPRSDIHHRVIDMRAYRREDGLYDVEAHLVDTKPFDLVRFGGISVVSAGNELHDLWIRLTVDNAFEVRDICAASDTTPHGVCKQAEGALQVLVGERLVKGWSHVVKERLRGAAGCTHLMEMLMPLASAALQGIRAVQRQGSESADLDHPEAKLDTCWAYGRQREIVQRYWPEHYAGPQSGTIPD